MREPAIDVVNHRRFRFGKNWSRFLESINETQICRAEQSLRQMLQTKTLDDRRFLDIGSGSGLFSLAARRLGACIHSFDYDEESVACAVELKHRYFPGDRNWTIEQGSVLDEKYVRSLGKFDVVYAWGVLHHTGAMWQAMENVHRSVVPGGQLFVAVYNDQGPSTRRWKAIKRLYNELPSSLRFLLVWGAFLRLWGPSTVRDVLQGRPFQTWARYIESRGMSPWRDVMDWVGGYPFEVATPEEVFEFYRKRGFTLLVLKTCGGGLGCNEFVFQKTETGDPQ